MSDHDATPPAVEDEHRGELFIDGRWWSITQLTFKERREIRRLVRQELGREDAEIDDAYDGADLWPAIVFVVRRRENPEYSYEQALEVTEEEVRPVPTEAASSGGKTKK